ncbi:MAG: BON domain-containing protein [Candidatus Solibacter sp.]|nr:BON domain-containing protein [Candidatus Solibacter sp.]
MANVRVWMAALLLAGGAWAAGPQTAAAAHQRPAAGTAPKREPVKPKLNDAQLEAAIRAKFAKSKINEDKFTVRVQGGVATIEGKTDVLQHKGVATRMSKTAGAVAVNNRVQVSDAAKRKAAGNLDEGRRRAQVKRGDTRSERK